MDIWFIGDAMLSELFPTLQVMKTTASMGAKQLPYMYDQYNVFCCYISQANRINNILTKLQHAVVEGFNRCEHLPRYIFIPADEDFLLSLNLFSCGIAIMVEKCVNWLSKQVECMLESRIEDLHKRKPGAVYGNTRIVWVKMFTRPEVATNHPKCAVYKTRGKMNNALDDIANNRKQTHVISVNSLESQHFDNNGKLNYNGKIQYWKDIDKQIKQFDHREIDWIPDQPRKRLPSPPQKKW